MTNGPVGKNVLINVVGAMLSFETTDDKADAWPLDMNKGRKRGREGRQKGFFRSRYRTTTNG